MSSLLSGIETVVFDQLPEHDTIWSFIEGVDGRLYAGVCGEMTGGMSAYAASHDPQTGRTEYILEMASAIGVPTDNGQGTHSKIHKCLLQDRDGTLYAASHCTGAPLGDWIWRPWNCWTHPQKQFSGSGIVGFRPDGEILFARVFLPHEGSRCMALAPERRRIYGLSYPRNHFFVYDLQTHEVHDIGRIGNINPQCVFIDGAENAYTTDDYGRIVKFDADRFELIDTGIILPHANFRNGYHNTLYDVVPAPEGDSVYGVTWTWGERLFRYDPKLNELEDFGFAYGEEDPHWDHIINSHVGGLVFGLDGQLYFVANFRGENGSRPHLIRFDPESGARTLLGAIEVDGRPGDHISRGALGQDGNLYFAEAGNTPTKLFKCVLDYANGRERRPQRRLWG